MSKFIKTQIKSVNADRISHILVFDEGSNEPRKVKKTDFNGGLPYKSAVLHLESISTDPPVITELYNDLNVTFTSIYTIPGDYFLEASSNIFLEDKTFVMINQTSSDLVFAQKDPNSLNRIIIGASTGDDVLNGNIEIRVYN